MLTPLHTAQFRTFGYTIVRRLLTPEETAALAAGITAAQRDAFGSRYGTPDGDGGIEGHYLPLWPTAPR